MKHYKIVENRSELTNAQVLQGMNFAAIQNAAALSFNTPIKAVAAKAVLLKTIVSLVILASSVMLYKHFNHSPKENKHIVALTDSSREILKKDTIAILKAPADFTVKPLSKSIEKEPARKEDKTEMPIVPLTEPATIEEPIAVAKSEEITEPAAVLQNPVSTKPEKPFKASPNVTCTIWNTTSFCNIPVKREHSSVNMECDNCEFHFVSCKDLDKQQGIKAVWLVVTTSRKEGFKIKTAFKNFTLVRTTGEIIYPAAIGLGVGEEKNGENKFFSSEFKAKKLTATFTKQLDIFLFFDNPKPGDKIFINDFIQAEIKE